MSRIKSKISRVVPPPPSPPVLTPTRYPLVLCHGKLSLLDLILLKFDDSGLGGDKPLFKYFQFVPEDLESVGCRVFTPKVGIY